MPRDLLPATLMLKGLCLYCNDSEQMESLFFKDDGACKYSLVALVTDVIDSSQRTHFRVGSAYFDLHLEERPVKQPF